MYRPILLCVLTVARSQPWSSALWCRWAWLTNHMSGRPTSCRPTMPSSSTTAAVRPSPVTAWRPGPPPEWFWSARAPCPSPLTPTGGTRWRWPSSAASGW